MDKLKSIKSEDVINTNISDLCKTFPFSTPTPVGSKKGVQPFGLNSSKKPFLEKKNRPLTLQKPNPLQSFIQTARGLDYFTSKLNSYPFAVFYKRKQSDYKTLESVSYRQQDINTFTPKGGKARQVLKQSKRNASQSRKVLFLQIFLTKFVSWRTLIQVDSNKTKPILLYNKQLTTLLKLQSEHQISPFAATPNPHLKKKINLFVKRPLTPPLLAAVTDQSWGMKGGVKGDIILSPIAKKKQYHRMFLDKAIPPQIKIKKLFTQWFQTPYSANSIKQKISESTRLPTNKKRNFSNLRNFMIKLNPLIHEAGTSTFSLTNIEKISLSFLQLQKKVSQSNSLFSYAKPVFVFSTLKRVWDGGPFLKVKKRRHVSPLWQLKKGRAEGPKPKFLKMPHRKPFFCYWLLPFLGLITLIPDSKLGLNLDNLVPFTFSGFVRKSLCFAKPRQGVSPKKFYGLKGLEGGVNPNSLSLTAQKIEHHIDGHGSIENCYPLIEKGQFYDTSEHYLQKILNFSENTEKKKSILNECFLYSERFFKGGGLKNLNKKCKGRQSFEWFWYHLRPYVKSSEADTSILAVNKLSKRFSYSGIARNSKALEILKSNLFNDYQSLKKSNEQKETSSTKLILLSTQITKTNFPKKIAPFSNSNFPFILSDAYPLTPPPYNNMGGLEGVSSAFSPSELPTLSYQRASLLLQNMVKKRILLTGIRFQQCHFATMFLPNKSNNRMNFNCTLQKIHASILKTKAKRGQSPFLMPNFFNIDSPRNNKPLGFPLSSIIKRYDEILTLALPKLPPLKKAKLFFKKAFDTPLTSKKAKLFLEAHKIFLGVPLPSDAPLPLLRSGYKGQQGGGMGAKQVRFGAPTPIILRGTAATSKNKHKKSFAKNHGWGPQAMKKVLSTVKNLGKKTIAFKQFLKKTQTSTPFFDRGKVKNQNQKFLIKRVFAGEALLEKKPLSPPYNNMGDMQTHSKKLQLQLATKTQNTQYLTSLLNQLAIFRLLIPCPPSPALTPPLLPLLIPMPCIKARGGLIKASKGGFAPFKLLFTRGKKKKKFLFLKGYAKPIKFFALKHGGGLKEAALKIKGVEGATDKISFQKQATFFASQKNLDIIFLSLKQSLDQIYTSSCLLNKLNTSNAYLYTKLRKFGLENPTKTISQPPNSLKQAKSLKKGVSLFDMARCPSLAFSFLKKETKQKPSKLFKSNFNKNKIASNPSVFIGKESKSTKKNIKGNYITWLKKEFCFMLNSRKITNFSGLLKKAKLFLGRGAPALFTPFTPTEGGGTLGGATKKSKAFFISPLYGLALHSRPKKGKAIFRSPPLVASLGSLVRVPKPVKKSSVLGQQRLWSMIDMKKKQKREKDLTPYNILNTLSRVSYANKNTLVFSGAKIQTLASNFFNSYHFASQQKAISTIDTMRHPLILTGFTNQVFHTFNGNRVHATRLLKERLPTLYSNVSLKRMPVLKSHNNEIKTTLHSPTSKYLMSSLFINLFNNPPEENALLSVEKDPFFHYSSLNNKNLTSQSSSHFSINSYSDTTTDQQALANINQNGFLGAFPKKGKALFRSPSYRSEATKLESKVGDPKKSVLLPLKQTLDYCLCKLRLLAILKKAVLTNIKNKQKIISTNFFLERVACGKWKDIFNIDSIKKVKGVLFLANSTYPNKKILTNALHRLPHPEATGGVGDGPLSFSDLPKAVLSRGTLNKKVPFLQNQINQVPSKSKGLTQLMKINANLVMQPSCLKTSNLWHLLPPPSSFYFLKNTIKAREVRCQRIFKARFFFKKPPLIYLASPKPLIEENIGHSLLTPPLTPPYIIIREGGLEKGVASVIKSGCALGQRGFTKPYLLYGIQPHRVDKLLRNLMAQPLSFFEKNFSKQQKGFYGFTFKAILDSGKAGKSSEGAIETDIRGAKLFNKANLFKVAKKRNSLLGYKNIARQNNKKEQSVRAYINTLSSRLKMHYKFLACIKHPNSYKIKTTWTPKSVSNTLASMAWDRVGPLSFTLLPYKKTKQKPLLASEARALFFKRNGAPALFTPTLGGATKRKKNKEANLLLNNRFYYDFLSSPKIFKKVQLRWGLGLALRPYLRTPLLGGLEGVQEARDKGVVETETTYSRANSTNQSFLHDLSSPLKSKFQDQLYPLAATNPYIKNSQSNTMALPEIAFASLSVPPIPQGEVRAAQKKQSFFWKPFLQDPSVGEVNQRGEGKGPLLRRPEMTKYQNLQKKRRALKQRRETGRLLKRKRFYPRPVWLRLTFYTKFLKYRHLKKSHFLLKKNDLDTKDIYQICRLRLLFLRSKNNKSRKGLGAPLLLLDFLPKAQNISKNHSQLLQPYTFLAHNKKTLPESKPKKQFQSKRITLCMPIYTKSNLSRNNTTKWNSGSFDLAMFCKNSQTVNMSFFYTKHSPFFHHSQSPASLKRIGNSIISPTTAFVNNSKALVQLQFLKTNLYPIFNEKDFYNISKRVITDFKKGLWKSSWLRSNLNSYLQKIKRSLTLIKETSLNLEVDFLAKALFLKQCFGLNSFILSKESVTNPKMANNKAFWYFNFANNKITSNRPLNTTHLKVFRGEGVVWGRGPKTQPKKAKLFLEAHLTGLFRFKAALTHLFKGVGLKNREIPNNTSNSSTYYRDFTSVIPTGLLAKNLLKWETALQIAEYNQITYERIQQIITNIKQGIGSGAQAVQKSEQTSFFLKRAWNSGRNKIKKPLLTDFSLFSYMTQLLQNPSAIISHKAHPFLTIQTFGNISKKRVYWALKKTHMWNYKNWNKKQYLWANQKLREQNRSNKTKKIINHFLTFLNLPIQEKYGFSTIASPRSLPPSVEPVEEGQKVVNSGFARNGRGLKGSEPILNASLAPVLLRGAGFWGSLVNKKPSFLLPIPTPLVKKVRKAKAKGGWQLKIANTDSKKWSNSYNILLKKQKLKENKKGSLGFFYGQGHQAELDFLFSYHFKSHKTSSAFKTLAQKPLLKNEKKLFSVSSHAVTNNPFQQVAKETASNCEKNSLIYAKNGMFKEHRLFLRYFKKALRVSDNKNRNKFSTNSSYTNIYNLEKKAASYIRGISYLKPLFSSTDFLRDNKSHYFIKGTLQKKTKTKTKVLGKNTSTQDVARLNVKYKLFSFLNYSFLPFKEVFQKGSAFLKQYPVQKSIKRYKNMGNKSAALLFTPPKVGAKAKGPLFFKEPFSEAFSVASRGVVSSSFDRSDTWPLIKTLSYHILVVCIIVFHLCSIFSLANISQIRCVTKFLILCSLKVSSLYFGFTSSIYIYFLKIKQNISYSFLAHTPPRPEGGQLFTEGGGLRVRGQGQRWGLKEREIPFDRLLKKAKLFLVAPLFTPTKGGGTKVLLKKKSKAFFRSPRVQKEEGKKELTKKTVLKIVKINVFGFFQKAKTGNTFAQKATNLLKQSLSLKDFRPDLVKSFYKTLEDPQSNLYTKKSVSSKKNLKGAGPPLEVIFKSLVTEGSQIGKAKKAKRNDSLATSYASLSNFLFLMLHGLKIFQIKKKTWYRPHYGLPPLPKNKKHTINNSNNRKSFHVNQILLSSAKINSLQMVNTFIKLGVKFGFNFYSFIIQMAEIPKNGIQSIYIFLEKPGELLSDWLTHLFLIEMASDLTTTIPENAESSLWNSFTKFAKASSLRITPVIGTLLEKRLLSSFECMIEIMSQPDTDLILRQQKGQIYWDIWGELLKGLTDKINLNITLARGPYPTSKTTQDDQYKVRGSNSGNLTISLFHENKKSLNHNLMRIRVNAPKYIVSSSENSIVFKDIRSLVRTGWPYKPIYNSQAKLAKTSFGFFLARSAKSDRVYSNPKPYPPPVKGVRSKWAPTPSQKKSKAFFRRWGCNEGEQNKEGEKGKLQFKQTELKHKEGNSKGHFLFKEKLTISNTALDTIWRRWEANQFITYKGKDSDLFIQAPPSPKSFKNLKIIQHSNQIHPPIGILICQIYSGIFYKDTAKNFLVVGTASNKSNCDEKSLLIQSLAGETEMKIIRDNANRYNFSLGIKSLRNVFDALALHTPCIFLIEDIHIIGERRPLLVGDDENAKAVEQTSGAEPHDEKNLSVAKLTRHAVMHYKKPFRGDFSFLIPTNNYAFDLFLGASTPPLWGSEARARQAFSSGLTPLSPIPLENISLSKDKDNQTEFLSKSNLQNTSSQHANGELFHASMLQTTIIQGSELEGISPLSSLRFNIPPLQKNLKKVSNGRGSFKEKVFDPPSTPPLTPHSLTPGKERKAWGRKGGKKTVFFLKAKQNYNLNKPKKMVPELPWIGFSENATLLNELPKITYSIRVKIALLAHLAVSNLSVKLNMITDLLVIIDSVRANRGFVVFATTHSPAILDPALRRPGRLDETIALPFIPRLESRWEIVKSNVVGLNFSSSFFKNVLYKYDTATFGYSGFPRGLTMDLLDYGLFNFALSTLNLQTYKIQENLAIFQTNKGSEGMKRAGEKTKEMSALATLGMKRLNETFIIDNNLDPSTLWMFLNRACKAALPKEGRPKKSKAFFRSPFKGLWGPLVNKKPSFLLPIPLIKIGRPKKSLKGASKMGTTPFKHLLEALFRNPLFIKQYFIFKSMPISVFDKKSKIYGASFIERPFDIKKSEKAKTLINSKPVYQLLKPKVNTINDLLNVPALALKRKLNNNSPSNLMAIAYSKIGNFLINTKLAFNHTNLFKAFFSTLHSKLENQTSPQAQASPYQNLYSTQLIEQYLMGLFAAKVTETLVFSGKKRVFLRSLAPTACESKPKGGIRQQRFKKTDGGCVRGGGIGYQAPIPLIGFWSLQGIDKAWRAASTLIFSVIEKRLIYKKNLLIPKLLQFYNAAAQSASLNDPPSPPASFLLLPAKRYENYKRTFLAMQNKHASQALSIHEKIQFHQKRVLKQKLYTFLKKPTSPSFVTPYRGKEQTSTKGHKPFIRSKPHVFSKQQSGFESLSSDAFLALLSIGDVLEKPTSINWYYRNRLLNRHRGYLNNQWWNGQLYEHNVETTFLSDVDWRSNFVSSFSSKKNKVDSKGAEHPLEAFLPFAEALPPFTPLKAGVRVEVRKNRLLSPPEGGIKMSKSQLPAFQLLGRGQNLIAFNKKLHLNLFGLSYLNKAKMGSGFAKNGLGQGLLLKLSSLALETKNTNNLLLTKQPLNKKSRSSLEVAMREEKSMQGGRGEGSLALPPTGVKTKGDVLIDFPDFDQHYNPVNRRWILNFGYWSYWYNFQTAYNNEIYSYMVTESFLKTYNVLNSNREILDFLVTKIIQLGLLKEITLVEGFKRF